MFPMLFPFRHTHFLRLSIGQAYSFICVYFCASAAIGHGCNTFRHVVGCLLGFVIMSKNKNLFSSDLLINSCWIRVLHLKPDFRYVLCEDFLERNTVLVLHRVCN